jgi:hypothetical protein
MGTSEKSFADYTGKATLIKVSTEGFAPPFVPQNPSDDLAVFGGCITACENKNVEVETKRGNYTNNAAARRLILKDVENRAMRTMANVKSVEAYKPYAKGLEILYCKVRKYKSKGSKISKQEKKKRGNGGQSFADTENHFKGFLAGLSSIPGYTHLDPTLQLPALEALYTTFRNKNNTIAELLAEKYQLTAERRDMFRNKNTGLLARMLSIKNAVKNQYGLYSPEYLSIKGVKI